MTSEPPSGVRPPVVAPPGWQLRFVEDFVTPFSRGEWPGAYPGLLSYHDDSPDTSGAGRYRWDTFSVHDSVLDFSLRTDPETGHRLGGVVVPSLTRQSSFASAGQTYGRWSVRFRADAVAGFGAAFLLWDVGDVWHHGEIDFPEGALTGSMRGYVHQPGDPARNALATDTGVPFADGNWHTSTVEWTPDGVRLLLDDVQVGVTAVSPGHPMRLTLQIGASGASVAGASGHVLIDWIAVAELEA